MDGFRVTTNPDEMDLNLIHSVLSQAYWSKGIPKHTIGKSIAGSLCWAIIDDQGTQVAFARAVTDSATFAYIADVFVVEKHRGKGFGKWIMRALLQHPSLQGLRRIVLATSDAHRLYQQLGFQSLAKPETFMEIWNPEVYRE